MIGKIIAGSSFAGTVGYVIKEQSLILSAEGVTPPDVREMVQDFKDQTLLNPRLKMPSDISPFRFLRKTRRA